MNIEAGLDKVIHNRRSEVGVQASLIAGKVGTGDFDIAQNVKDALTAIEQAKGVLRVKDDYQALKIPTLTEGIAGQEGVALESSVITQSGRTQIIEPSVTESCRPPVEAPVIFPPRFVRSVSSQGFRFRVGFDQRPDMQDIRAWSYYQIGLRESVPNLKSKRKEQVAWEFLNHWEDAILYQDDDIVAVDKPSGISSQYSGSMPIGVEEILRLKMGDPLRLLHRLDTETSGLILGMKRREVLERFRERLSSTGGEGINKYFLALLDGDVRNDGVQDVAIKLAPGPKYSMVVVPDDSEAGLESLTRVLPIAIMHNLIGQSKTLTQFEVVTGFKHQIRKVAEYLGAPVQGDDRYNSSYTKGQTLMLHSLHMDLEHPITGKKLSFTAPPSVSFKRGMASLTLKELFAKNIHASVLGRASELGLLG